MNRLERKELQARLRIIEARVLALRAKGCKPHRIRRIYCRAPGSPILYHHADVLARSAKDAIRAAQEGRVTNWWMVDSFDRADHAFVEFQYLFQTSEHFLESAERRPQLPRRRPYPAWGADERLDRYFPDWGWHGEVTYPAIYPIYPVL